MNIGNKVLWQCSIVFVSLLFSKHPVDEVIMGSVLQRRVSMNDGGDTLICVSCIFPKGRHPFVLQLLNIFEYDDLG